MESFKIGEVVRIVDNDDAKAFNLDTLGLIGKQFKVDDLTINGVAAGSSTYPDTNLAIFDGFYIPPTACELVADVPPTLSVKEAVDVLVKACHGASLKAGWWHDKNGNHLKENPLIFSNKLMLTVSELAEAMEGDRKNLPDDKLPHRSMREVELADALIRLCDLAGAFDMDLGGATEEKMAFNAIRPDHKKEAREAEGGKAY